MLKTWGRRTLYFVLIMGWLLIMIFPTLAFMLARNGEMTVAERRIFLVQDTDAGGVGVQWSRPAAGESPCAQTIVRYLMWDGDGVNARSCMCDDGVEREPLRRQCVVP